MRNALRSGVSRYRESPLGRLHVHLGRLLGVYVLLVASYTVGLLTLEYIFLGPVGLYGSGVPVEEVAALSVFLGVVFSPVPALAVVSAWSGWESREEAY